ncbi:MAG: hypothetical protein Ta2G_12400 [Termitinemataceae bacterium]|nr:MAG: hypothetical protein Ta2G_12400 [Termitinemataceae bacterium]
MPWSALKFEIHLTDNCNLNCAHCLHFSSLCETAVFLDIVQYENDIKRLSCLASGKAANIRILGGEPLLHSSVIKFIEITRKYFPITDINNGIGVIELVTNGILLQKQTEQFWEICKTNNIGIVISDYPIKINKEYINDQSKKYGIKLTMNSETRQNKSDGSYQQWVKVPIDLEGKQNIKKSFGLCFIGGGCFQLVDGKIYKCARIAYIKYFNKKFNKNLIVCEEDYIDIYKVNNIDEILDALTEPALFCRYCKPEKTTWKNEWRKTTGEISEWI